MSKTSTDCALERVSLNGATMGTRYTALFHADAGMDTAPLAAALFAAVDRVDRQMSSWKPESDLNRLNAAPVGLWVPIPPELGTVLATGLRIGRASHGAFDLGMGDFVARWGFGPAASVSALPQAAAPIPAHEKLEVDPSLRRARRLAPVSLDVSGIAKGYGVDELARVMDAFAISAWLVGIDGEMRAKGLKPDGSAWVVAQERPVRGVREAMGVIELSDSAIATSGNYRHFREHDGRTISHTMDPRTGLPLDNGIASVTVLAPTGMEADAWATAFMVMDARAGLGLARLRGMEAIFVNSDGAVESTF